MIRLNVIFFKMVYFIFFLWIKIFGVNDVFFFFYGIKLWICVYVSRFLIFFLLIYYCSYNLF